MSLLPLRLVIVLSLSLRLMDGCASAAETTGPAQPATDDRPAFRQAIAVFTPQMEASDARKPVDYASLRAAMERFAEQFPDSRRSVTLLTYYMDMFRQEHPEQVAAEWASFTGSRSPLAARLAQGKVRFFDQCRKPLEMAFAALDGRPVDLRQLRGKVVLVDFWATWCAPCMKQLPTLKRLHATYHARGFEIVGVSLDREADKAKLLECIARNEISWPQYFDGKVWETPWVLQFAIDSAPTTFLLGPDGIIVATNLEGAALEQEIQRLLTAKPAAGDAR